MPGKVVTGSSKACITLELGEVSSHNGATDLGIDVLGSVHGLSCLGGDKAGQKGGGGGGGGGE